MMQVRTDRKSFSIGSLVVALAVAALVTFAGRSAQAGDDSWTVLAASGGVQAQQALISAVDVYPGYSVAPGTQIETGADGRVVMVRDGDSITVSPDSQMKLPVRKDGGVVTEVIQTIGTLLFKVETRPEFQFEVETPYMAAVVKGTTFTVSVNMSGTALHVTECAVQVTATSNGQTGLIVPGQTAVAASAGGAGLDIRNAPGESPSSVDAVETDAVDDSAPSAETDTPSDGAADPVKGKSEQAKDDARGQNKEAKGSDVEHETLEGGYGGGDSIVGGTPTLTAVLVTNAADISGLTSGLITTVLETGPGNSGNNGNGNSVPSAVTAANDNGNNGNGNGNGNGNDDDSDDDGNGNNGNGNGNNDGDDGNGNNGNGNGNSGCPAPL